MGSAMDGMTLVVDIGGTTTRGARLVGDTVEKVVQCPTPSVQMSPDVSIEVLQEQLCELIADLVASVSVDAGVHAEAPRVAIAFSGRISNDGRSVLSAPDVWGAMSQPFPLAEKIEERLANNATVKLASDVVALASQFGKRAAHIAQRFALLVVRTDLKYAICESVQPHRRAEPILLGHLPFEADSQNYECLCGVAGHMNTQASSTGAVNVIICSALQNPKAFRSSYLFKLAAQRSKELRFEQRLALQRRHAVRNNAKSLIDEDVWRNMHDRHAEITPGEMQRWVLPVMLDAGMFIEAVNMGDEYALELLGEIAAPVAQHIREQLINNVDVVALTGGFARALGEAYRERIAPPEAPEFVQWAEDDNLDDLRATQSLLYPVDETIIDLRESVSAI